MRREGRVAGKPTNRTRATGKCRRVGCLGCHSHPVNKSLVKTKGHVKRTAWDITRNHHLDNWRLCTDGTYDAAADVNARSGIWSSDTDGATEVFKVFEYPTSHSHAKQEEEEAEEEQQSAAESGVEDPELEEEDVDDDDTRVALQDSDDDYDDGVEEKEIRVAFPADFQAFRHLHDSEIFKSGIDDACKRNHLPVSEDSWSGIDLSDDDNRSQTSWDDWSLVDEEVA